MSALGATVVFLGRGLNRQFLDGMLGFAAGVIIAASYWSLGAMIGFAVMMTLDVAFG